jgi:hypothetical protein
MPPGLGYEVWKYQKVTYGDVLSDMGAEDNFRKATRPTSATKHFNMCRYTVGTFAPPHIAMGNQMLYSRPCDGRNSRDLQCRTFAIRTRYPHSRRIRRGTNPARNVGALIQNDQLLVMKMSGISRKIESWPRTSADFLALIAKTCCRLAEGRIPSLNFRMF